MTTFRIQINDKVLDKVLWLLGHFSKDEVSILEEDLEFLKQKKFIREELQRMDAGEVDYISVEEMNQQVKERIAKYED
jgi:hypothetical protein